MAAVRVSRCLKARGRDRRARFSTRSCGSAPSPWMVSSALEEALSSCSVPATASSPSSLASDPPCSTSERSDVKANSRAIWRQDRSECETAESSVTSDGKDSASHSSTSGRRDAAAIRRGATRSRRRRALR